MGSLAAGDARGRAARRMLPARRVAQQVEGDARECCSSAKQRHRTFITHCSHATPQRIASTRRCSLQGQASLSKSNTLHESAARSAPQRATMGKGGMDYKGQKLSEQIYLVLIPAVGSVAWVFGYVAQDFKTTFYGWLAGLVSSRGR